MVVDIPGFDPSKRFSKSVLVIDDDLFILGIIKQILSEDPSLDVEIQFDPEEALKVLNSKQFAVVVSDIKMPSLSGLDLLKEINRYDENIQVILMTGSVEAEVMVQAIKLGAYDFLRKPFDASELTVSVRQAMLKNHLLIQNSLYQNHLEVLVQERSAELLKTKAQLEKHYLNTISAMINAIEVSDIYTVGHSERVTAISLILGKALNLDSEELRYLRMGAMLHDLGKIGRVNSLITKAEILNDDEYQEIMLHPSHGAKIIEPLGLPKAVGEIILQHHERPDGSGYPNGISNLEISFFAKIVSVADSYDAMTSRRAYRENLLPHEAVEELKLHAGKQFDQQVVDIFCNCFDQVLQVLQSSGTSHEELLSNL